MTPGEEQVFWLGKFLARQDLCRWFRDFEGKIVICEINDLAVQQYKKAHES
jgi:hypothetical protein